MKNLIFVLLTASGFFLAIYFYRQYTRTRAKLTLANQRILDRDRLIYTTQKQLNDLSSKRPTPVAPATDNAEAGALSAGDLTRLQQSGLANPVADLRNDLLNQQATLLPKSGPGSAPTIRAVNILNDRYALASFTDGPRGGYVLLRFTIAPNKRIAWQVLDAY